MPLVVVDDAREQQHGTAAVSGGELATVCEDARASGAADAPEQRNAAIHPPAMRIFKKPRQGGNPPFCSAPLRKKKKKTKKPKKTAVLRSYEAGRNFP